MNRKVLVTGGAGYIGSHTCSVLVSRNYEVLVVDNLSTGWDDFVKWSDLVNIDLRDEAGLRSVMRKYRPDVVCHFAASAYAGESVFEPLQYHQNNVQSSYALLSSMLSCGLKRLVFSSSCSVYGNSARGSVAEDAPINPLSPYGHTKAVVEQLLCDLHRSHKLSTAVLRYFNAAGADWENNLGERHRPETHAIPLAVHSCFDGEPFKIFGDAFDTRDGTAERDYVHVIDLARGHADAVDAILEEKISGFDVFNLGSGEPVSVLQILDGLRKLGLNPHSMRSRPREGDPARIYADYTKAHRVLGWAPERSDLAEVLLSAVRWHEIDSNA